MEYVKNFYQLRYRKTKQQTEKKPQTIRKGASTHLALDVRPIGPRWSDWLIAVVYAATEAEARERLTKRLERDTLNDAATRRDGYRANFELHPVAIQADYQQAKSQFQTSAGPFYRSMVEDDIFALLTDLEASEEARPPIMIRPEPWPDTLCFRELCKAKNFDRYLDEFTDGGIKEFGYDAG